MDQAQYYSNNFDWDVKKKSTDIYALKKKYFIIGEIQASLSGENIAFVYKTEDGFYKIYHTKKTWINNKFDKVWNFKFAENGSSYCNILSEDGWSIAVDGKSWKKKYDYVWNTNCKLNNNDLFLTAAVKEEMQYYMVSNEKEWSEKFFSITYSNTSPNGKKTAAVIQTEKHNSGEIDKFKKKIYTVTLNGKKWKNNFLNVWNISFSNDSKHIAAEGRININEYCIIVDDIPWSRTFDCVWKPLFNPKDNSVSSPIRLGKKWGMAVNGDIIWSPRFYQVWNQRYDPTGSYLASVVSCKYGRWTVAINDKIWECSVDSMLTDLTFSNDGKILAVLGKNKNFWYMIVNDSVWTNKFDMIWPPVFSKNGKSLASKVKKKGKFTYLINNKVFGDSFDKVWDPVLNEDGTKILMRYINNNKYVRRIEKIRN